MLEESSSKNRIHFDKRSILKKLNASEKYQSGTTTIIRWEDDLNFDTEMYILKNKYNNLPFIGVVNFEFKREGYCINKYLNGDNQIFCSSCQNLQDGESCSKIIQPPNKLIENSIICSPFSL